MKPTVQVTGDAPEPVTYGPTGNPEQLVPLDEQVSVWPVSGSVATPSDVLTTWPMAVLIDPGTVLQTGLRFFVVIVIVAPTVAAGEQLSAPTSLTLQVWGILVVKPRVQLIGPGDDPEPVYVETNPTQLVELV